jgi:biopolymer transport protein ExbB
MLTTFQGLASGSGGQKTMDMVAGGISEALITTETGLIIALPGLFFQYHLTRERERHEAFLAQVETACAQFLCVKNQVRQRSGVVLPPPVPER